VDYSIWSVGRWVELVRWSPSFRWIRAAANVPTDGRLSASIRCGRC